MHRTHEAKIDLFLSELRLPTIKGSYRKIAADVSNLGGDYLAFLEALLREESTDRHSRKIDRRIREAKFPQQKTLGDLEVQALPSGVTMGLLQELAAGSYMETRSNIIAIGGSGTGKSHVSVALGMAACQQGHRVRFYTASDLVSELEESQENHTLHKYLKRVTKYDLLIVDELGYLPIHERGAQLLFQVLSSRHECGSTIINSNLAFSEWGEIFKTERLAIALLDRVTHNAHILEMNGESYRLRSVKEKKKAEK